MTKLPWDFSTEGDPTTGVVNAPCEMGAQIGAELARLAAPAMETCGVTPCSDCAFRLGTPPNRSLATVMDALKASAERTPFLCHTTREPKACAGWLACSATGPFDDLTLNPEPPCSAN